MSSIDIAVERAPEGLIDATIYKRRRALFSLFFIIGLCMATWVSRTPDIRDSLSATTAEMGMVLFGLSLGSIIGVLSAAVLVRHFGTKPIVSFGVSSVVLSLSIMAVGASLSIALVVAAGLFAFGLGMATAEIALNIEGANVEQIIRRSVLTQLHGFFRLRDVSRGCMRNSAHCNEVSRGPASALRGGSGHGDRSYCLGTHPTGTWQATGGGAGELDG